MKALALYSIKGGVGKTASAVNLAWLAARSGARTLLWDLDPQGAASFHLRVRPRLAGGARGLLQRETRGLVKESDYPGLDVLPSALANRKLDRLFEESAHRKRQVQRLLRAMRADYDLVLIDAPPGLGLLVENILRAADLVLCPVIPSALSLRTLEQLQDFVRRPKLRRLTLRVVLTMVDRRRQLHREVVARLLDERADVMRSVIPYASDVERMGELRAPVGEFAPRGNAARAYARLWRELQRDLECNG